LKTNGFKRYGGRYVKYAMLRCLRQTMIDYIFICFKESHNIISITDEVDGSFQVDLFPPEFSKDVVVFLGRKRDTR